MTDIKKHSKLIVIPIALIVVFLDQVSKIIVRSNLGIHENIEIIQDVFILTHTENTGAAFSLFTGHVSMLAFISILANIIIITYLVLEKHPLTTLQLTGWGFLLGGTNGNLIDRVLFGSVTDFINITIINFPIFNFADIFIDIGAAIVILTSIFPKKFAQNEQKE